VQRRTPRFDATVLPITSAVAAAVLASCSPSAGRADRDVAICRDGQGRRLSDASCSSGARGGYGGGWYYLARGSRVPAVGEAVSGGSEVPRAGVGYARASAATVTRGGFGMSAHGFGGE